MSNQSQKKVTFGQPTYYVTFCHEAQLRCITHKPMERHNFNTDRREVHSHATIPSSATCVGVTQLLFLTRHLYKKKKDVWFGVDQRTNTVKTRDQKRLHYILKVN